MTGEQIRETKRRRLGDRLPNQQARSVTLHEMRCGIKPCP